MYLKQKCFIAICGCLLFVSYSGFAQDDAQAQNNTASMTLGVVVPTTMAGLSDASVSQLANKLADIVTNNGFATDSSAQVFTISPKFDIVSVDKTSAEMQNFFIAKCTLNLFVKQTSNSIVYAQKAIPLKGIGNTKELAIANAVAQISPDDGVYQQFLNNAKEKIAAYYQQNCQQFLTRAQREIALGHYNEANKILSDIPPEAGSCYDDAQQKTADIFEKQYGSLDKAVVRLQQQATIDPASSIFSKLLSKAKNLLQKRNAADKTPPEIELTTPKTTRGQGIEADVTPEKQIFVSGTAHDPSGISSVTVNGQAVTSLSEDGFFQTNIDAGVNDIIVVATDKKGNSAPVTFHIASKIESKPAQSASDIAPIIDNERYHAIFIANTVYSGTWDPLPTTISEAKSVMDVFEKSYGFSPADVDTLFNKSRKEILTAVSQRLANLTPNDNLIIFYGGHGYYTASTNTAYWVPSNATSEFDYISNADITHLLSDCPAKHILIMADACFSGAMRGGMEVPEKYEYKLMSRQLLTSGGIERVPGKSAYVPMVLAALNANTDKYLSANELYLVIHSGIKDQGHTDAQLKNLEVTGSQGGQFYFRKN